MTLKQAKEMVDRFYKEAVYRIEKCNRDLYDDHVLHSFVDKCSAISETLIWTENINSTKSSRLQDYYFEMQDKLIDKWYDIKHLTA